LHPSVLEFQRTKNTKSQRLREREIANKLRSDKGEAKQVMTIFELRSTWVDTSDLYMKTNQIRSCISIGNNWRVMGNVSIGNREGNI
jgi:hypothetical protein